MLCVCIMVFILGVMWRSEVKLEESVLFVHYVGPGDGAAVVSLAAGAHVYEPISLFYSLIFLPPFLSYFSYCLRGGACMGLPLPLPAWSTCMIFPLLLHAWGMHIGLPLPLSACGTRVTSTSPIACMGCGVGLTLPLHEWGCAYGPPSPIACMGCAHGSHSPLSAWGTRMGLTLLLHA